jgi:hypothetical protein
MKMPPSGRFQPEQIAAIRRDARATLLTLTLGVGSLPFYPTPYRTRPILPRATSIACVRFLCHAMSKFLGVVVANGGYHAVR